MIRPEGEISLHGFFPAVAHVAVNGTADGTHLHPYLMASARVQAHLGQRKPFLRFENFIIEFGVLRPRGRRRGEVHHIVDGVLFQIIFQRGALLSRRIRQHG